MLQEAKAGDPDDSRPLAHPNDWEEVEIDA